MVKKLVILFLFGLFLLVGFVSAAWLPFFGERIAINVTNINNSYVTYYQNSFSFNSTHVNFNKLGYENQIVITDNDGITRDIPFYIDYFNQSERILNITFQVPILEPLESKIVYLYYDNSSANSFYVPPLGNFQKEENHSVLLNVFPENIVYDNETNLYWMCAGQSANLIYSSDLETWINDGSPSGIPSAGHSCFLLKYNNQWYFYRGRNVSISSQVNGTYTPSENNPMYELGADGEWDDDNNGEEVSVLQYNGTWYMFYMGDQGSKVEQVGYLTGDSPEGPWTRYSENPVLRFGSSGSYDAGTVADPFTYILNNLTYVFYSVSPTTSSPWINAYAITKDFVNFFKRNVILATGNDGSSDGLNAHRGGITLIGDYYYFPYTGKNLTGYNFGLAKQYAKNTLKGYPPEQVYELYDSFTDSFLKNQWRFKGGSSSYYNLSDEKINITSGDGSLNNMIAIQEFNSNVLLESKFRIYNLSSNYFGIGFGNKTTAISGFNREHFVEGNLSNSLNSSNVYAEIPFSQNLNLTSRMTLEAFIYPYDNTTAYQGVIARRQDNSTPSANYALWLNGDKVYFGYSNAGNWVLKANVSAIINKNQWYHVAAQWDADSDRTTIFLDGALIFNSSSSLEPLNSINTSVTIGSANYVGQYLRGLVDEVRISNITRYSGNFEVPTEEFSPDVNTMALVHFDETTGRSIKDSSFESNNGSLFIADKRTIKTFEGIIAGFGEFFFLNRDDVNYNLESSNVSLEEGEHTVKIKWVNSSLISYKLDEGGWVNNTQDIYETATLNPMFIVGSDSGNTTLEVDYIKVTQNNDEIRPLVSFINASSLSSSNSGSTSTEDSSSPGGITTYHPSEKALEKGYTKILRKGNKVKITVVGEDETLIIKKIDYETKEIVVSVSGEDYAVQENSYVKIDTNNDGYYDTKISVSNIRATGYADFEFKSIYEEVPSEEKEEKTENILDNFSESVRKIKWFWYAIAGGVVILGVILRIVFRKRDNHFFPNKTSFLCLVLLNFDLKNQIIIRSRAPTIIQAISLLF